MIGGMPFVLILGPIEQYNGLLLKVQAELSQSGNVSLAPETYALIDPVKMDAFIADADRIVEVVIDNTRNSIQEQNANLVRKHITPYEIWHYTHDHSLRRKGGRMRTLQRTKIERII